MVKIFLIEEAQSGLCVKDVDVMAGRIELVRQECNAARYTGDVFIVERAADALGAAFPGLNFVVRSKDV